MVNHKNEYLGDVSFGLSTTRSDFHFLLYQYAMHLGIDVRLDARVMEYFEHADKGGVILENRARLTADLVVSADGVGSRAGVLIKGERDRPSSSGYAMLRATYPVELALQNPLLKHYEDVQGSSTGVVGPGAHVITGRSGNSVSWMLTHKVCQIGHGEKIQADGSLL
jgi:2-polyprenyl-6-methoxyphenol hydroxylase-like FAD-dependent oxidoreductase